MIPRRGDVVTIAEPASDYGGKPRPAVIVRSDAFADIPAVTVCPFTSVEEDVLLLRLRVEPSPILPIDRTSWIMIDKITTVRGSRIGAWIGRLSGENIVRLDRALIVYLGIG